MLTQIADGVFVSESEFLQSNSVVVRGRDGVLVVDPGLTDEEMTQLADDIRGMGQRIVAGFATHPDWDHVLWHAALGDAPRYGTALCAATMAELLAQPDWPAQVAAGLPPEYADQIPLELFGAITPLPRGAVRIPWDGPAIRIIEHRAHAKGHAALLVEEGGVLIAGDMLSDILMPFVDVDADQPLEDYLAALGLFEEVAEEVGAVVPGHGSVASADRLRGRIAQDRAYVAALRAGDLPVDARVGEAAPVPWLADMPRWQLQRLAERADRPPQDPAGS